MRVKNGSKKRDFKYNRRRDNTFLKGRDAGMVRYMYSMVGYGITISVPERHCPREGY